MLCNLSNKRNEDDSIHRDFISDMNQHKPTFYASRCFCLNTMHLISCFTINSVATSISDFICTYEFLNLLEKND